MLIRRRYFDNNWDNLIEGLFYENNMKSNYKLTKFKNDDGDKYIMAVPGLQKKDLKVSVENNILSVSYELSERSESMFIEENFSEKISLSSNVNVDGITSTLKDGILTIEIPRIMSEVKKIKTIEIR